MKNLEVKQLSVEIPTDTIIDKVFAGFKKITPALVAVSLASGAVLFLPARVLNVLGLNELPKPARTTIGILFLLSTILIVTIFLSSIWQKATRKMRSIKLLKELRKRYIALAPEQKKIVLELLKDEEKVIFLDEASGNTQYLLENNFIYRPWQAFSPEHDNTIFMKYIPHPWLIDLYNKEPKLFNANRKNV